MGITAALTVLASGLTTTSTASAAEPGAPYAFGTLVTQPAYAAEESRRGVKVAMLELGWRDYEPVEGQFNAAYAQQMRARLDAFRAHGMQVTLSLGMHYTPAWLLNLPNSRFVDQNGAVASDANLVFNQALRTRAERYFDRVRTDLGLQGIWAIRLTSGGNPELLYPGTGTYWAFDVNAQNGPNMPATMPRNPFPGWKPGGRTITTQQVSQWTDWYVKALADVADWQMRAFRERGFTGYFQVLTPGSGARPSVVNRAVTNYLPNGITGVGAVWHKLYEFLPDKRNVVAYVSSMADGSGRDDSCTAADRTVALTDPVADSWSATRWIGRIADEHGLAKNGENPGWNYPASLNPHYLDASSTGMMAATVRQMTTCRFQGIYWAHSEKLWDGTVPFSRYADHITRVNGGVNPTPPPAPALAAPTPTSPTTPAPTLVAAPAASSDTLLVDQILQRGSSIRSLNGKYTLTVRTDGTLVLRGPSGRMIWSNGRSGGSRLIMQGDGNLVAYTSKGAPVWATGTAGSGGSRMVVQGDGNLVVYSDSRAVWSSGTAGRV